jgi:hypothetical protein
MAVVSTVSEIGLSCSNPDNVWVGLRHFNISDGRDIFMVKNRFERVSVIDRLPHSPGPCPNIKGMRILLDDCKGYDSPPLSSGPYFSVMEKSQKIFRKPLPGHT